MSKTISQLSPYVVGEMGAETFIPASDVSGKMGRLSFSSLADSIWDNMYIRARAVIVPCTYCHSHNAISNSNCVSCGAPMGEANDDR